MKKTPETALAKEKLHARAAKLSLNKIQEELILKRYALPLGIGVACYGG